MDELVSRQVALVAVKDALMAWSYMPEWRDEKIIEAIAELPIIQSEIVMCKNCTHYYGKWCFENRHYFNDYDFCSRAERRAE